MVKHIGVLQKLPELAESLLPAGSKEKAFYAQMYKTTESARQVYGMELQACRCACACTCISGLKLAHLAAAQKVLMCERQ